MSNLKLFIVCHSIDAYNHFISLNKIKDVLDVDSLTYLFVGDTVTAREVEHIPNKYICRELPNNIERYKTLLAFTAWYAIINNDLAKDIEYVGVFEYDCVFNDKIEAIKLRCERTTLIGFALRPIPERLYLGVIENFLTYLSEEEITNAKNRSVWNASTNCIVSTSFLDLFVKWYMTFIPAILHEKNHSHFHERAINICAANLKMNYTFLPNSVKHLESRSHKFSINDL